VRGDKFILEKLWVKRKKKSFLKRRTFDENEKKCIYIITGGTWTQNSTSTTEKSIAKDIFLQWK